MSTAPAVLNDNLSIAETRRSAQQMLAQRQAIVELMQKVMKKDIDYGIIPGTDKPTLYKPGSEKILSMFNLSATPTVEDIGTPDTFRYRVHVLIKHIPSGMELGTGIGEASSAESKYQWRAVVCNEEWDATPEDRRRTKWKKGTQGPYSIRQVRAEAEDVANTILKMSKKRGQIDAVLTATAASEVFAQDLEDLVDAGLDPGESEKAPQEKRPEDLQKKAAAPAATSSSAPQAQSGGPVISESEAKRWWAVAIGTHKDHIILMNYLRDRIGVGKKDQIPAARYQEAMQWAEGK